MRFQNIRGKTLEQILKNVKHINMSDLVDFYNEYSGEKVKKFSDRDTAVLRVKELVTGLIEKKRVGEANSNGSKPSVPAISKAGWTALVMFRETLKNFQSDSITVEELAIELNIPGAAVQKTVNTLERDGFLILETKGTDDLDSYSLSELGKTAKQPGKKASKAQTSTKVRGTTGPRSTFAGKKIYKLVKENPYNNGSRRDKNFKLIKDGMLYENFVKAGGDVPSFSGGVRWGHFQVK